MDRAIRADLAMDNSRANSLNHAPISSRFVFFPFDLLLKLNKARGIQTDFFSVSKNFCIGCFGNERRERSIGTIGRERASKERERERERALPCDSCVLLPLVCVCVKAVRGRFISGKFEFFADARYFLKLSSTANCSRCFLFL